MINFHAIPESLESKFIDVLPINEVKEKFGIIAMLDALGTRNLSIEQSKELIQNILFIKNQNDLIIGLDLEKHNNFPENKEFIAKPNFFTFQDTIIITLETKTKEAAKKYLHSFADITAQTLASALVFKVLLRGAISVGNYIEYDKFILGEALYDAANYYESFKQIGIVATPNCGKFLTDLFNDEEKKSKKDVVDNFYLFNLMFSEEEIELKIKDGDKLKKEKLWIVNWPLKLSLTLPPTDSEIPIDITTVEYYHKLTEQVNFTPKSKIIIDNTDKYIKKYFEKFPELNKLLSPDIEPIFSSEVLSDEEKKIFINCFQLIQERISQKIILRDKKITLDDLLKVKIIARIFKNGFLKFPFNGEIIDIDSIGAQSILSQYEKNSELTRHITIEESVTEFFGIKINLGKVYCIVTPIIIDDSDILRLKDIANSSENKKISLNLKPGKDSFLFEFFKNAIVDEADEEKILNNLLEKVKKYQDNLKSSGLLPLKK